MAGKYTIQSEQMANLMPPEQQAQIEKAKKAAQEHKAFVDTNEELQKKAEEEKGEPLTFLEKNKIVDEAKEKSNIKVQANTDEAKKITTMTPEEYQASSYKATDVVSILRDSGMNDDDIQKELTRLNFGKFNEAGQRALGMEVAPSLEEQTATLNQVEKANPNLEALDEERKEIHDKAVEDKIELEPEIQKYMEQAESLIDPNYIENIPRNIWRDFARGDFGRRKIDPKVKEEYDKIKKIPKEELTDEQKKTLDTYKKQLSERRDANSAFGSLILNQVGTGLGNWARFIKGGDSTVKSDYDKITESKLAGGLERYNKKYSDMANMDTSLLNSAYQNDREIDEQLKKVYADKSVQPYLTKLDLDTRRIFVNYVAAMGKNLKMSDLPGLMAGLWAFQDTGNMNKSTMDLLGKAGSGLLDLVKTLIPGV